MHIIISSIISSMSHDKTMVKRYSDARTQEKSHSKEESMLGKTKKAMEV